MKASIHFLYSLFSSHFIPANVSFHYVELSFCARSLFRVEHFTALIDIVFHLFEPFIMKSLQLAIEITKNHHFIHFFMC